MTKYLHNRLIPFCVGRGILKLTNKEVDTPQAVDVDDLSQQ